MTGIPKSHWKCHGLWCLCCNFPLKLLLPLDFGWISNRGKHHTHKEFCIMCLFCSSVQLKAGDSFEPFQSLVFQIFFQAFFHENIPCIWFSLLVFENMLSFMSVLKSLLKQFCDTHALTWAGVTAWPCISSPKKFWLRRWLFTPLSWNLCWITNGSQVKFKEWYLTFQCHV